MQIVLDGIHYTLDNSAILDIMRADIGKFAIPNTPEASKYAAERIAIKAAIRPWYGRFYGIFARILGVADWHDLKPAKHGDLLEHTFYLGLECMDVILTNSTLELERENMEGAYDQLVSKNSAWPVLRVTRAVFTQPNEPEQSTEQSTEPAADSDLTATAAPDDSRRTHENTGTVGE